MRPLLRVEALIFNHNMKNILVQCDTNEGFYRLPGGSIEFGESAAVAIEREFAEEYDLQVTVERFAAVNEHIFEVDNQKYHHCTLFYWCAVEEDEQVVRSHKEHPDIILKWKEISELKTKLLYPEGVMKIIEQNQKEPVHWLTNVTY
ncbi:NUDIX domain-containing protein [Bacillus sp. 491mf]|uniref:NUDIX hydrolase n=1 Tax=Bacillus sp. 491mf TaxID=1761755 RepID=UPI0008EE5847|nr:NUDIX domain-containing protein [Bacillus sp. 491mf]SFB90518.1 NUDIX domain-containing protein [Bacillus sp. 491mf]